MWFPIRIAASDRPDHARRSGHQFSGGLPNLSTGALAAGSDGNIWFTDYADNTIGRISPQGIITEFSTDVTTYGDYPYGLAIGADGNLWFTVETTVRAALSLSRTAPSAGSASADRRRRQRHLSSSNPHASEALKHAQTRNGPPGPVARRASDCSHPTVTDGFVMGSNSRCTARSTSRRPPTPATTSCAKSSRPTHRPSW